MSLQAFLTALLLPPVLFVLAALTGGILAWRDREHQAGRSLLVAAAALGVLLLATPFVSGHLIASLEHDLTAETTVSETAAVVPPAAIIILSAEVARRAGGAEPEVGPLTLERLRAGAAQHRRTGLPVLVTGGPIQRGDPPLAALMARSLAEDFGVPVRWIESHARDTRENAEFSAALLREAGIRAAWLVTHAWHMPRSHEAFARAGVATRAAPVRIDKRPNGACWSQWVPRADYLGTSWFALREWAGRLVYALRDGESW
jgi:uncharacterized SAM-binding protein YcdF (DUF218 family)